MSKSKQNIKNNIKSNRKVFVTDLIRLRLYVVNAEMDLNKDEKEEALLRIQQLEGVLNGERSAG